MKTPLFSEQKRLYHEPNVEGLRAGSI